MQFSAGVGWGNAGRESMFNSWVKLGQPITPLEPCTFNDWASFVPVPGDCKCINDTSYHSIAHIIWLGLFYVACLKVAGAELAKECKKIEKICNFNDPFNLARLQTRHHHDIRAAKYSINKKFTESGY